MDDDLIALTNTGWLQGFFDALTKMFNRLGLRKNVGKIVRIICQPCRAVGKHSNTAYT